jgi:transcriptional regulator with XRE-family HTH domain
MTDETTKQIANNLKQIRLKKGLTQFTLAEEAGINSNYYAKIERGEIKLNVSTLKKISKALKVKSTDILSF